MAQSVNVLRRGRHNDSLAVFIEDTDIEALPAQIQSSVQHGVGPPSVLFQREPKFSPEEVPLHDIR